jgi:hypothetical protein
MVEVLPFLGSEGSFLRKDEVGNFPGLRVTGVYAVYKASELAYSEANYPAGDYGLVFVADQNVPGVVLQIRNGEIIRIDYIYNISSLSEILKRDAAAMILEPQS